MKHVHLLHSKVIARLLCLIVTLALFAPCLPRSTRVAHAAERQTRSERNFGPPGAGLPDLNRARETNTEPSRAGERVPSPEPDNSARPANASPPPQQSDSSSITTKNGIEEKAPSAIQSFNDVPTTHPFYSQI